MRNLTGRAPATSLSGNRAAQLFVLTAFAAVMSRGWANPQGGSVVQGSASIETNPAQLIVRQTTDRAVINWQSFSIGQGEGVEFRQPSSSSVTLNRVTGQQVSEIHGRLDATGQVWLVNPNGVFFGPDANVNVAGLLATTLDIADADFMAGRHHFQGQSGSTASVENQGRINIRDAGLLAFVAPGVANSGLINARLGSVTLASGQRFTVDLYGDQRINLALDDATVGAAIGHDGRAMVAVQQDGTIFADGGSIQIAASAARGLVDRIINVGGVVQAQSVEQRNGRIVLSGGAGSTLNVSGTLDASGRDSGEQGGEITLRAPAITLTASTRLDASGDAGGGLIEVGGSLHGLRRTDVPVANAQTVVMQAGSLITADAISRGDGGDVSLWADGDTRAHGTLSATGGALAGDGGFIETSGAQTLDVAGIGVSTLAPAGAVGTWLLDPTNININQAAADTIVSNLAGGNVTLSTGIAGDGGPDAGVISVAAGVLLQPNLAADRVLTLSAFTDIDIANSVRIEASGAGRLNLVLNANTGAGPDGAVRIGDAGAAGTVFINTNGGNLVIGGGSCTIVACSGNASATAGRAGVDLYNTNILLGSGSLNARGQSSVPSGGGIFATGTSISSSGGTITLEGVSSAGVGQQFDSSLAANSISAGAGSIVLRGTGVLNDLSLGDVSVSASNISLETGSNAQINPNAGTSFVGTGGGVLALRPILDTSPYVLGGTPTSGGVFIQPNLVLPMVSGAFTTLELGRRGSTASTTIDNQLSTNILNVSVFGGSIAVTGNGSIFRTSAARGQLRLQARSSISIQDGALISASGSGALDVILASNANSDFNPANPSTAFNNNSAFIDIGTGTGGSGVNISTNGGNFIVGGGADCATNQCFYNTTRYNDAAAAVNFVRANVNLGIGGTFTVFGQSSNSGGNTSNTGSGISFQGSTINGVGGQRRISGSVVGGTGAAAAIAFEGAAFGRNAIGSGTSGFADIRGEGRADAPGLALNGVTFTSPNINLNYSNTAGSAERVVVTDATFVGGGFGNFRFYPLVPNSAFNVGNVPMLLQASLAGYTGIDIGNFASASETVLDQSFSFSTQRLTVVGDSVRIAPNVAVQYTGTGSSTLTLQALSALPIATNFGGVFVNNGASITAASGVLNVVANGNGGSGTSTQAAVGFSAGSSVTTRGGNVVIGGGTCTTTSCTGMATSSAFVSAVSLENSTFNLSDGSFFAAANSMFNGLGLYSTGSSINTGNGNISLRGISQGQTGLFIDSGSLNAGTGNILLSGFGGGANPDLRLGTGFTARNITLELSSTGGVDSTGASFTGNGAGTLAIRPQLDASSFNVGGAVAGAVYVDAAPLLPLATGFSAIELGRSSSTALTTIGAALSANSATLRVLGRGITLDAASNLNNVQSNGAVVLSTGTGVFTNNASNAFSVTAGGRWLVYSNNVDLDSVGNLTSAFNRYGCTLATGCVAGVTVPTTGNGFLYVVRPTVSLNAGNATSVYGSTPNLGAVTIGFTGLRGGDTGVAFNVAPSFTTTATALTNVGTAPINVNLVGLTSNAGYLLAAGTSGALSITPASLSVTANNASPVYSGVAFSGGNGVSFSGFVNGQSAAALGGTLAFTGTSQGAVNVGSYAITPGGLTSSNYALSFVSGTLNVTPASLSITANPVSRVYSGTAMATGGGVSYAGFVAGEDQSVLTGTLSYSGASQTAVNVGSYAITPGGQTSSNYLISNIDGQLQITPASLSITASDASRIYDGLAFSGGNGVSFSGFVNGETAAVLAGTLGFGGNSQGAINAGTYVITPNGLSSSNYSISTISGGLTVSPAALTITANDASRSYSGVAVAGGNGVSYTGFVNGETSAVLLNSISYAGSSQTAVNVGSYGITPGGQTSSNYSISFVAGSLSITPASLNISANDASRVYDGLAFSGGNGVGFSGFVNGETASVLGGTLGFTGNSQGAINTGAYVITPGGFSSSNYALSYVSGTLSVSPASLSITANNASRVYDGLGFNGGNGVSYAGFVNGETAAVLGGTLGFGGSSQGAVNVGSYAITPGGQTSSNYLISNIDGQLQITPASLSITASDASRIYDGLAFSGGNGVSYSGFVNGETASVLLGTLGFTGSSQGAVNAGTYGITPGGQFNSNYSISYVASSLSITTANLSIAANAASRVYDGLAFNGGNGVSYSGFVNGETASVLTGTLGFAGSSQGAVNVGSYGLTPTGQLSSNYSISYVSSSLSITPASLGITASDAGKIYDGLAFAGGNGVSYTGFVNGESASVLGGALSYVGNSQGAINAGSYAITPTGFSSSNYTLSYASGVLNVTPASLSITAIDAGKIYDGLVFSGGNGVSYAGFVNGESASVLSGALSYVGSSQGAINAGSYAVTPTGLSSSNYTISTVDGSLQVNQASLSITASDAGKIYDGLAFTGGNGVSYAGFVNGEDASVLGGALGYVGSSQGAVNAGSYAITPTGLSSGNYRISTVDGSLQVSPAGLSVTAVDATRSYSGVAEPGGNGMVVAGLVNGETAAVLAGQLAYGGDSQSAVNVGRYTITPGGLQSDNYAITYVDGQLSITPRALSVTAEDDARFADGTAYSGGNGVRYAGFVNGEGAEVLQGTLGYTGSSQGAVEAGSYVITPTGLDSSNYAISYADGTLNVAVPTTIDLVVVVSNVVRSVVASVPSNSGAPPEIQIIEETPTPAAAEAGTAASEEAETTETVETAEAAAAVSEAVAQAAAAASSEAAVATSPAAAPAPAAAARSAPAARAASRVVARTVQVRVPQPSLPPLARPATAPVVQVITPCAGSDCVKAVAKAAANDPPQLTAIHAAVADPMAASYDEMPWIDNSGVSRLAQPKQVRSYLETLETTNLINVLLIIVP
ncbi:MAG: MBG domain-containing protein [Pseudomonadota bacterium]